MKLYRLLAAKLLAKENCEKTRNQEWLDRHSRDIERLVKDHMPSGSGVDAGTKLDWNRSTPQKLVFETSYHHMNDSGYYDGWTEHTVIVRPSLWNEIEISIGGSDRNDIKEYLHQVFHEALMQEIEE